jgi:hypothetical protein
MQASRRGAVMGCRAKVARAALFHADRSGRATARVDQARVSRVVRVDVVGHPRAGRNGVDDRRASRVRIDGQR